jgi:hypothetical protein
MILPPAMLLLCIAGGAAAAGIETLTPQPGRVEGNARWVHEFGRNEAEINALAVDAANVEYRFDLQRHAGKKIRIGMTIPRSLPCLHTASLRVEWRSRTAHRWDSSVPGQRVILFEGMPRQPFHVEALDVTLRLDARDMKCAFDFLPEFDLESD